MFFFRAGRRVRWSRVLPGKVSIAMGIPSAWGYFTPFIVVFLTSIAQAGVWSMYRDIFQGSR